MNGAEFEQFLVENETFITVVSNNRSIQDYEGLRRIREEFPRESLGEIDKEKFCRLLERSVEHWEQVATEKGRTWYSNIHLEKSKDKIKRLSHDEFSSFRAHLIGRLDAWDQSPGPEDESEAERVMGSLLVPFLRVYHPDLFMTHTKETITECLRRLELSTSRGVDVNNNRLTKYLQQNEILSNISTAKLAWIVDKFLKPQPTQNLGPREEEHAPEIEGPPLVRRWAMDRSFRRRYPNLILYGPPGTGKTYVAGQIARWFEEEARRSQRSSRSPEEEAYDLVTRNGLGWMDVVALALYDEERQIFWRLSVPEIRDNRWIIAKVRQRGRTEHIGNTIWAILQEHARHPKTYSNRREPFLFEKDDQGRWSLCEEGKEHASGLLARIREEGEGGRVPGSVVTMVTFHPTYSYEDFIEGLRPTVMEDEEGGELRYEVRPGVLREICQRAQGDPERDYLLVIDEINRGHISKVFGEVVTLIEKDKRFHYNNQITEWENERVPKVRLPQSAMEFFVPDNLFLLGTMNTADRSIALIDIALRRRFAFIELTPDVEILRRHLAHGTQLDDLDLCAFFEKLNERIAAHLDRDHCIGHSYFLVEGLCWADDPGERRRALWEVWNFGIMPLMEEYFYGRDDQLKEVFRGAEALLEISPSDAESRAMTRLRRYREDEVDDLISDMAELASPPGERSPHTDRQTL